MKSATQLPIRQKTPVLKLTSTATCDFLCGLPLSEYAAIHFMFVRLFAFNSTSFTGQVTAIFYIGYV